MKRFLSERAGDSWAEVELFRWQYGELPKSGDRRKLDRSVGLSRMADAIAEACKAGTTVGMPSPFNLCEVLRYISRRIGK
jgi:hypothetical protein